MRYRRKYTSFGYRRLLGGAAAVLTGLAALAGAVFLFGWLLTKFDAGEFILSALSLGSVCLLAYFAGFAGARYERECSIMTGIVSGLSVFVMIMIGGSLLGRAVINFSFTTNLILSVISGMIGALSGCSDKK